VDRLQGVSGLQSIAFSRRSHISVMRARQFDSKGPATTKELSALCWQWRKQSQVDHHGRASGSADALGGTAGPRGRFRGPRGATGRRRCFCIIPASARRASFASAEVGKTAATSRSKITTALPAAYRDANLLDEPRLKSYSGRISSVSALSAGTPLLRDFFIVSSLWACGLSGADDANRRCALNVHDCKQTTLFRNAQQYRPLLYG